MPPLWVCIFVSPEIWSPVIEPLCVCRSVVPLMFDALILPLWVVAFAEPVMSAIFTDPLCVMSSRLAALGSVTLMLTPMDWLFARIGFMIFAVSLSPVDSSFIFVCSASFWASCSVVALAVIVAVRSQLLTSEPLMVIEPLCVFAAKAEPGWRGADRCTVLSNFSRGPQPPTLIMQPATAVNKDNKKTSDIFIKCSFFIFLPLSVPQKF